jgi:Tfp pilus assembly protein PilZ
VRQPHSGNFRLACVEPCTVAWDGRSHAASLWNLSVVGVYVVLGELPVLATPVSLAFTLPGESHEIRVAGRVAWLNPPAAHAMGARVLDLPPGCGVEFLDLTPEDRARIEERVGKTYKKGLIKPGGKVD